MTWRHRLGLLRSLAIYYWQPGKLRLLRRFYRAMLPPKALCFDIGAHVGNRTAVWRSLGATVVAVEPQEVCLRYLRHRFSNDPQVHLLPVAIDAEAGTKLLHVSALTPTITTLAGADWQSDMKNLSSFHVEWEQPKPVTTTTMDHLIGTYGVPDFCKIDVEDFELEALLGLSQPLPLLSFEYLAARAFKTIACIERLESLGQYEYNWSFGESHRFQQEQWLPADEMVAILKAMSRHDRSGDLYARLLPPD